VSAILRRIERELGHEGLVERLASLAGSDLNSLLMAVMSARAERASARQALEAQESRPLFAPSLAGMRESVAVIAEALRAFEGFEAPSLSPVAPQGTARSVAGVSANNVLAALRGAEIPGDPSPLLALEAVRRRRKERGGATRLCTVSRVIRLQPVPVPGLLPHFQLFAAVTAGRAGDETELLRDHLARHLAWMREHDGFEGVAVELSDPEAVALLLRERGADAEEVRREARAGVLAGSAEILSRRGLRLPAGPLAKIAAELEGLPAPVRRRLEGLQGVLDALQGAYPSAALRLDLGRLEGMGYYAGPTLRISARDATGAALPIVDGGFTSWTQTLLRDHGERLLTTGFGVELIASRFARGEGA
jgi:hypothetical protein